MQSFGRWTRPNARQGLTRETRAGLCISCLCLSPAFCAPFVVLSLGGLGVSYLLIQAGWRCPPFFRSVVPSRCGAVGGSGEGKREGRRGACRAWLLALQSFEIRKEQQSRREDGDKGNKETRKQAVRRPAPSFSCCQILAVGPHSVVLARAIQRLRVSSSTPHCWRAIIIIIIWRWPGACDQWGKSLGE